MLTRLKWLNIRIYSQHSPADGLPSGCITGRYTRALYYGNSADSYPRDIRFESKQGTPLFPAILTCIVWILTAS
jgi:hypothetical protein